jgi:uncharacterized phage protein (TIGR01671 family)
MTSQKFRIWNKSTNCFVSEYENTPGENRLKYFISCDGEIGRVWYGLVEDSCEDNIIDPTDYVIQHCIGLVDMMGKEIFEGDFVENKASRRFLVEYERMAFTYREYILTDGKWISQAVHCNSIGSEELCQIIGNLYQPPV